jgi:hypothetical protein
MNQLKNFNLRSFLFDFTLMVLAIYTFIQDTDHENSFKTVHPAVAFFSVGGMLLFVPVYAIQKLKSLIQSGPKMESAYENWLGSFLRVFLYPFSVLNLLLTGLGIGYRAGLLNSYAIGIPFTLLCLAVIIMSVYLCFIILLEENECGPLTARLHESDIKNGLDRVFKGKLNIWFTVLLQPFIFIWMDILLNTTAMADISMVEKFMFLLVSGYLPLRVLVEFEPPFRPLNIIMGLIAMLVYSLLVVV